MREQDLRQIVEEVVKVLAAKGLLKEGSCGCPSPSGISSNVSSQTAGPRTTTIGTAGKVFSDDWQRPKSPIKAVSSEAEHHEHTGSGSCPFCDALLKRSESELKAIGCDRVGVCHPTK